MENSCRICLEDSPDSDLFHLFKNSISKVKYFNLIKFCTGIEIKENENHPKFVCKSCLKKLEIAKEIKTKCIESDEILKSIDPKETSNDMEVIKPSFEVCEKRIQSSPVDSASKNDLDETSSHEMMLEIAKSDVTDPLAEPSTSGSKTGIFENQFPETFHIQEFKTETELEILDEMNPLNCEFCGKKAKSPNGLYRHINRAHKKSKRRGGKPFQCDLCGTKLQSRRNLDKHMETHIQQISYFGKITTFCSICQKDFLNISRMAKHHSRYHAAELYKCEICGAEMSVYERPEHLDYHNPLKANEFRCEICSKTYKRRHSLKLHKKLVHLKIKNYQCLKCNAYFGTNQRLNQHMASHDNLLQCPMCLKNFKSEKGLELHMLQKNDKCEFCCHKFVTEAQKIQHVNENHLKQEN